MFKMVIIGSKSKIAQSILSHPSRLITILPESSLEVEQVDYLILASSKDKNRPYIKSYTKSPNLKILDFSGILKERYLTNDPLVTYAFHPVYEKKKNLVAMPGCSSLAIMQCLYPIKHLLKQEIFIDVKFPRSSLKHNSSNLLDLDHNIKGVLYSAHPHQQEVSYLLKHSQITITPSVIDIPSGLSLNIFLPNTNYESILGLLNAFYSNNKRVEITSQAPSLKTVVGSGKTTIYISASYSGTIINAVTDNLINERYLDFIDLF